jgi:hypothetical protein
MKLKMPVGKTVQQRTVETLQFQVQLQPSEAEICGGDQRPRQQQRSV